jgi:hypothetical protein
MVNYKLGKIYTIRSSETVGVYVGSTCQSLAVRFGGHKSDYKKYKNIITISNIFNYGVENAYIELLENYPCNSREELHKREGEHMRMMENCVNKLKPRINHNKNDYYICNICNVRVLKQSKSQHNITQNHEIRVNLKIRNEKRSNKG